MNETDMPLPGLDKESGSRSLALRTPRDPRAAVEQALLLRRLTNQSHLTLNGLHASLRISREMFTQVVNGQLLLPLPKLLDIAHSLRAEPREVIKLRNLWHAAAEGRDEPSGTEIEGEPLSSQPYFSINHMSTQTTTRVPHKLRGLGDPPSPLLVDSVAEFVAKLNEVRLWAGNPSLRDLVAHSDGVLRRATVADMLNKEKLPKYKLLMSFLSTCGIEDRETWAVIWRRLHAIEDTRRKA